MEIIESKTVRTTRRLKLGREELLQLLAPHYDYGNIPPDASIFVKVPGGGDWSNTDLDIDDKTSVIITWTEVTKDV